MSSRSQVVEKCVTFSKFSFFPSVLQWKKQKTSARKMDPHWVPFEQRYEFPHGKICKTGTSTGTGPKSQASQGLYNLLGGEVSSGVGGRCSQPFSASVLANLSRAWRRDHREEDKLGLVGGVSTEKRRNKRPGTEATILLSKEAPDWGQVQAC